MLLINCIAANLHSIKVRILLFPLLVSTVCSLAHVYLTSLITDIRASPERAKSVYTFTWPPRLRQNIPSPQEKSPCTSLQAAPPPPGPYFLPLQISFCFSQLPCEWNSTTCPPLRLATFTQHEALEIYLSCGLSPQSLPFPRCVVLHPTNAPPFTNPSSCWETLVSSSVYINDRVLHILHCFLLFYIIFFGGPSCCYVSLCLLSWLPQGHPHVPLPRFSNPLT